MQDTKNNEISDAIVFFQNLDLDVIASVFRIMCVYYTSSKLTQGAIVQIDYRLPKYQKVKMLIQGLKQNMVNNFNLIGRDQSLCTLKAVKNIHFMFSQLL